MKQIDINTFAITKPQPLLTVRKPKNGDMEIQNIKINYTQP